MSEQRLRIGAAALALLGTAVSGYLFYVRETGAVLVCGSGGCEAVQSSRYAEILGVPVAALGLGAYSALFLTSLARGEFARTAQAVIALAALVVSAYFVYVQLGIIGQLCDWCLVSDGLTTALAALALLRLRNAARTETFV